MTRLAPGNQDLPPWVNLETERKKRRPKAPTPADMPKAKPEVKRLHIRIELAGSVEMLFEGAQATELRCLLDAGPSAEEVLEALDPWSSGAVLKQEIRVLEDPDKPGGEYFSWAVSEERGTVLSWVKRDGPGPFYYRVDSPNPHQVNWRVVP